VIPARPTATYTVTVTWPSTDWTIEGADDAPYSARDLCPRGGGGGGGHDGDDGHDGHDGGHGAVEGERTTFPCVHTVVMRQMTVVVPPADPPAVEPVVEPVAPVAPAVTDQPTEAGTAVAASPVGVTAVAAITPRALPTTGNSVSLLLLLAGLLTVAGSVVVRFSRPTSGTHGSGVGT
jgi:LPXTG-motif cell wall-anchored protein